MVDKFDLPPLGPVTDPKEIVIDDEILSLTGLDKAPRFGELRSIDRSAEKAMRKIAGQNPDRTDEDQFPL